MNPGVASGKRRAVLGWLELGLLAIALVLPLFLDDFWVLFATKVAVLGLLALSFDLVWGYAGIMSFGQALFFGMAGYSAALLATQVDITSVFVLLPLGALVGLLVSFLVAVVVLFGRRVPSMVFVALGTLTGSYVVERLARGWSYVGGQNGIPSLPRLTIGAHDIVEGPVYFYMVLGLLALVYIGLRWITRSQFGLVLAGIRQQEDRLTFLGYKVQNYKGVAFCLAGTIAGLAGVLYVFHEGYVGPGQLGPGLSTLVVLYVLFGGAGTLLGALLGAGLIELLSFFLADQWETGWPVVLGLLLLAVVMFRPTGLIGLILSERERVGSFGKRQRRGAAGSSTAQTTQASAR